MASLWISELYFQIEYLLSSSEGKSKEREILEEPKQKNINNVNKIHLEALHMNHQFEEKNK